MDTNAAKQAHVMCLPHENQSEDHCTKNLLICVDVNQRSQKNPTWITYNTVVTDAQRKQADTTRNTSNDANVLRLKHHNQQRKTNTTNATFGCLPCDDPVKFATRTIVITFCFVGIDAGLSNVDTVQAKRRPFHMRFLQFQPPSSHEASDVSPHGRSVHFEQGQPNNIGMCF